MCKISEGLLSPVVPLDNLCCYSVALLFFMSNFVDPMDCSTPGFPVLHHLPEFAQTHVHWVGDVIQPSHPLLSPLLLPQSFPATGSFLMSWLFTSGSHSIGASASVLPMTVQGWFPVGLTGLISLQSKGRSRVSPAPQFECISSLVLTFFIIQLSHPYMTMGKKLSLDYLHT